MMFRLALALAAFPFFSASADMLDSWCRQVRLPSSIAICSDPELRALAIERQQVFNEARGRVGEARAPALMADQNAWVASYPKACGLSTDVPPSLPLPSRVRDCMARAGRDRVVYLRDYGRTTGTSATLREFGLAGVFAPDCSQPTTEHEGRYSVWNDGGGNGATVLIVRAQGEFRRFAIVRAIRRSDTEIAIVFEDKSSHERFEAVFEKHGTAYRNTVTSLNGTALVSNGVDANTQQKMPDMRQCEEHSTVFEEARSALGAAAVFGAVPSGSPAVGAAAIVSGDRIGPGFDCTVAKAPLAQLT
ncbi:MAG TPA: hypothetical protein VLV76_25745 [Candidatus Acidoferrum sp.]|nr:hypothetical protein [Candidatus Acidoferrum sp.]